MTSDSSQLSLVKLPARRAESEFLLERLADEVLVYDPSNASAHCLSRSAALIWDLCDGVTSTRDAAAALRASGAPDTVESILAQLSAAGLVIVAAPEGPARSAGVNRSRRALLARGALVAGAVLASPVIFSIVAPSVAEAASLCGAVTQPCCPVPPGNTKCNVGLKCTAGICQ